MGGGVPSATLENSGLPRGTAEGQLLQLGGAGELGPPWYTQAVTLRAAAVAGGVGVLAVLLRRYVWNCSPLERLPLEGWAEHQPNFRCDTTPKPGVERFRDHVLSRFGGGDKGIINRTCGPTGPSSEHHDGRAWDWRIIPGWTIDGQYTEPDLSGFLKWLLGEDCKGRPAATARRAGIMYVLWHDKAWRSYDTQWGKAGEIYTIPPGTHPHLDHVHISFGFPGSLATTSLFTAI